MRGRRLAALSAGAVLLLLFLFGNSPGELVRRADFLARTASSDLDLRRLSGSGAAFDRNLLVFLQSLRRTLPRDTRGVALYVPRPSTQALYLASYVLAPVPVLLAPGRVPPRWVAALYGPPPEGEWQVLAPLSGGTLAIPR